MIIESVPFDHHRDLIDFLKLVSILNLYTDRHLSDTRCPGPSRPSLDHYRHPKT